MATHATQSNKAAKTSNPDDFTPEQVRELSDALNPLLADVFVLYIKTKNFHWHMSGPHFRDYHLLLDEQADQIFAISDAIAERVRKIGGQTIRSIGQIARLQRIKDNDYEFVPAHGMLEELQSDNRQLVKNLREAHEVSSDANDYATTSLIEVWIDEAERRAQLGPHRGPCASPRFCGFSRQQGGARPFAAEPQSLAKAQDGQQGGGEQADAMVSRQKADRESREPHQQQRADQGRLSTDAIAKMPKDDRPQRPRDKGHAKGGHRSQQRRSALAGGEEEEREN